MTGTWINTDLETYECSKCGWEFIGEDMLEEFHFCPHCGADMREK